MRCNNMTYSEIYNKNNNPEPRLIFTKIDGKLTLLTKDELALLFEYKMIDEEKQDEVLKQIKMLLK